MRELTVEDYLREIKRKHGKEKLDIALNPNGGKTHIHNQRNAVLANRFMEYFDKHEGCKALISEHKRVLKEKRQLEISNEVKLERIIELENQIEQLKTKSNV